MSRPSLFAGIFGLLICVYVWIIISLFLTKSDFNPIQDALDIFFPKLEEFLIQNSNSSHQEEGLIVKKEEFKKFVEDIRVFCSSITTATLVVSVVYAISCILMMIGTKSQKTRCMMIPYIVLQLFFTIILINNSFFLNLTLLMMPQYSSVSSWVFFAMFIVIVMVFVLLFYKMNMIWIVFMFTIYLVILANLPIAFFGVTLNSLASLHIPFAMCLMLVRKVFTELESKPRKRR